MYKYLLYSYLYTHTHAHTHTKREMKERKQMKLIDENIIDNIAILAYGSYAR